MGSLKKSERTPCDDTDGRQDCCIVAWLYPIPALKQPVFPERRRRDAEWGKESLVCGVSVKKDLPFNPEPVFMQRGLCCYRQPRQGRERG